MSDNLYIKSPVYQSQKLLKENGLRVFYKMDCHQPTLSFKIRGMEHLCRTHVDKGVRNFIASSGGNAGYSLAYVGKHLGVQVKIVVPSTTPQTMIDKIIQVDAEVEIHGEVWDEAHEYALKLAKKSGAVYVSPFDDPLLWEGHSTIIDEAARQMDQPDKIIVSVGGGGLLCGIFEGMKRNGWEKTKVITTETHGAQSFLRSFEANKIIELDAISTVATSLGAKKITPRALELSREFDVIPFSMSDEDAIESTVIFAQEFNALVEPACGAALSVPYLHSEMIRENETVLVIVCGGANTSNKL